MQAQGALNIDNVEGPPGAYTVTISGSRRRADCSRSRAASSSIAANGKRRSCRSPAVRLGVGHIALRLEGPNGFTPIERSYDIQSRAPFLPITYQCETQPQAASASWRAPGDALATFQPARRR